MAAEDQEFAADDELYEQCIKLRKRAETAEREVQEWLCPTCRTVHPTPSSLRGFTCPSCKNGILAPHNAQLLRELERERDVLAADLQLLRELIEVAGVTSDLWEEALCRNQGISRELFDRIIRPNGGGADALEQRAQSAEADRDRLAELARRLYRADTADSLMDGIDTPEADIEHFCEFRGIPRELFDRLIAREVLALIGWKNQ